MKAWLLDSFNGLSGLRLADAPEPTPQPAEAILELHFAALNPADRYLAENQYPAKPPLPHILGRDGVGAVERGSATDLKPGDIAVILRGEVGVNRWGTFAEYVIVPADYLVPLPAGWTEPQ